jgi:hypothetical protein
MKDLRIVDRDAISNSAKSQRSTQKGLSILSKLEKVNFCVHKMLTASEPLDVALAMI